MRWFIGLVATAVVAGACVLIVLVIDGIPPYFDRPDLRHCGSVEPRGGPVSGPPADCFDGALRHGDAAELVVIGMTDEGNDVFDYYRAVPEAGPGVAIFTESHEDAYGTVAWSYPRCPSAGSLMALGPCTTEAL